MGQPDDPLIGINHHTGELFGIVEGRYTALDSGNYEVMQFTGLKDKNGKEIYEGDIVRLEQWEPEIYEVVFNRGGFCFRHSDTDVFYHDAKYIEKGEVIGNIYENPELLQDK